MIPKLINVFKSLKGIDVYFFDTGVICTEFKAEHIDMENIQREDYIMALENYIQGLKEGIRTKFISSSQRVFDEVSKDCARNEAVQYIGWTKHELVIRFEKDIPPLKNLFSRFIKKRSINSLMENIIEDFVSDLNIDALVNIGLKLSPQPCNIIVQKSYIKKIDGGLRIDSSNVSVLKLHKLGNFESEIENLAILREGLSDPYQIVFSVKKIDEKETQYLLNNKSKREESGSDLKSHKKYLEAQKALEEIDNQGKKIFEIEMSVVLYFQANDYLIQESFVAKSRLNQLADFGVEDFGVLPALVSTLPGGKPHITNLEMTDRIPSLFPILIRGRESLNNYSKRSLIYHRQDDSLDELDIFDAKYSNFSALVVGRSGRGKSVFTNTLEQSLLNDPDLKIILVDVKGSHTNTVKRLGGAVHQINTSNNTAISPFNFLRSNKSKDVIEIISDFVEKLLIESHETSLKRLEQAQLEKCLLQYVNSNPSNPSVDDFIKKVKDIPRVESLSRWQKDGIYGSIFSNYNLDDSSSRLHYFDFTNIITAQKGGVGSAVMSAIMAHFNFTLLTKETHEKLVFIADETPFFIRSCYSSFNLLMKNVRKLNGSLILIAQNLSDLVVDNDSSLINQAELRVFFSKDSGNEKFKELSGLSDHSLQLMDQLSTVNGRFSQFIIKDHFSEKIGQLKLSKEEYYRASTHSDDRSKIKQLKALFNLRDENQAIEILADIGSRYELIH